MNNLNYKYELDSVRGFAVLIVCIVHFYTVNENVLLNSNYYLGLITFKMSSLGTKGVELFFILSGYLITRILLASKSSSHYFFNFYTRRFLRIFPLYYLVLFLCFIIYPIFYTVPAEALNVIDNQWKLWAYISNTHFINYVMWDVDLFPNFGHFWSLSVEEHFYLVWPFLVFYVPKKYLLKTMVLISIFSLSTWFLGQYIEFLSWTSIQYAASLSLGGIVAYYENFDKQKLDKFVNFSRKYFFILVFIFLLFGFLPRSLGYEREILIHFYSLFVFLALLLIAIFNNNKENKFFNSKFLIFIGKISYGLYVFHALLRPFFKEYIYYEFLLKFENINGMVLIILYTIISIAISIFLAWLSWNYFESKVLKYKHKFEDVKLKGIN